MAIGSEEGINVALLAQKHCDVVKYVQLTSCNLHDCFVCTTVKK